MHSFRKELWSLKDTNNGLLMCFFNMLRSNDYISLKFNGIRTSTKCTLCLKKKVVQQLDRSYVP